MVWCYAKEYVARLFRNDRTLNDVYAQMLEGYYGAPERDGMSEHKHANDIIPSYIEHMHKYLVQSLQSYGIACSAIVDYHGVAPPIVYANIDDDIEHHQDGENNVVDALVPIN